MAEKSLAVDAWEEDAGRLEIDVRCAKRLLV